MRLILTALVIVALQCLATSNTTHAQSASTRDKPMESAVPPSRAGDLEPSFDYAAALTAILQQIVTEDGMVRYDFLRTSLAEEFRGVLKAVEEFDARSLASSEEKLAFWMNAYNVQMLQNVLEAPAVEHIIEDGYVEQFFKTPRRIAGQRITLDQIEHVILRGEEGPRRLEALRVDTLDPRLHVGINCAAASCPALRPRAFTAANVHEELDRAMRDFMRRERHVRMEGGVLVLSSILDWFGGDFDLPGRPAGDFLLAHMPKERDDHAAIRSRLEGKTAAGLKRDPDVRFEYDWSINRARPAR